MPSKKYSSHLNTAVLSLLLAVFIWVIANYEQESPRRDRFPSPIPVQVSGLPANMVAVNDPVMQVEVDIRAFASSWDTLTVDSFMATADWSQLQLGVNIVPIEVVCADRTVTIEAVYPETMVVQVEEMAIRQVDVAIELTDQDELPLGYEAMPPSIEPVSVTISGARSFVESVAQVTGSVSLANQRTTYEEVVHPKPVDAQGRVVDDVKVSPETVKVRVIVQKKENFREVAVRARTSGTPERGYFVSSVSVSPSTVTVYGPPEVIDQMGSVVDVQGEIDTTGATRSFVVNVALDLPDEVQVYGASPDEPFEVTVSIGIDAVIGGATVELPLRLINVGEGLTGELSVPVVDVLLTGPSAILDSLDTSLLEATVDVSGLSEGTHQVTPRVSILAGADSPLQQVTIKGIQPEYVQVTLARPPAPGGVPLRTLVPTITPTASPARTP
ncbi:MAG: CdaR family protein [Anaerolineales bacterium]